MTPSKRLRQERADLIRQADAVMNLALRHNRALTIDERQQIDNLLARADELLAQINEAEAQQ